MSVYFPDGPTVWRVSYGYQFEQFENLPKAMRYIEKNLTNGEKHMLTIQKVNLRSIEKFTPEYEQEVDKLGR